MNDLNSAKATLDDISRRFRAILTAELGMPAEEIRAEDEIANDLGADSLDQIHIIMAAEVEFQIDIYDDEAMRVKTVSQAESMIEGLLNAA